MDKEMNVKILLHHAKPILGRLNATIFQQDNDPRRTAKVNLAYLRGDKFPASLMPCRANLSI